MCISIQQWENDIDSFSTEEWSKIHSIAKAALEKDPDNPGFLSLMGNVYEWNSFQSDDQFRNN